MTENGTGSNPGATHTRRTQHPLVFNDAPTWCLGKPTTTQWINSHTLAGGTQITRVKNLDWDLPYCRLKQEVLAPGTALQVTSDHFYDGFGNVDRIVVTPAAGSGQAARTTLASWGTDGRFPRSVTNPEGHTQQFAWDIDAGPTRFGLLRTITDANTLVTTLDHDEFGRPKKQIRPDGTAIQWDYVACDAECTGIAGAHHKTVRTLKNSSSGTAISESFVIHDALGREVRATNYQLEGGKSDLLTVYAGPGWIAKRSQPHFTGIGAEWTSFVYDQIGRVKQESRPRTNDFDASTYVSSISYEGLAMRFTDAAGKVTLREHDGLRQIIKVTQAYGTPQQTFATYEYNSFGDLLRASDAASPANSIVLTYYDERGWKKTSSDPDMGQWSFEYFPLGELKKQTDAKGQLVTFSYDRLSRLTSRADPEGGSSWTWGNDAALRNKGRLESASSSGWQEEYTYDSIARPLATTTTIDGTGYTFTNGYNATTGLLETVQYPASYGTPFKLKYEYETANKSGLLKKVSDFNAPTTVFWEATSTNAFSQYGDFTLGGTAGAQTENAFDSVTGAINHIETSDGISVVQNFDYRWDKVGNLQQRIDVRQSNLAETLVLDSLHRVTSATLSTGPSLNFSYDASGIGNIASKTGTGSYNYTAIVSGCNYYTHTQPHAVRQISGASSQSFCYDQNGNMTKRNGATISWYSWNLPQTINQADGMYATFYYDANRARYKQVALAYAAPGTVQRTTIYVGSLFEKLVESGATSFTHHIQIGGDLIAVHARTSSSSVTRYLLGDHLGSTEAITAEDGTVLVRFSNDAWGMRRDRDWDGSITAADMQWTWSVTNRGFTEHEQLDNLGLIHMNGRVYDPGIGRFISADPLISFPFHTQSLNRYSYVLNNPLTLLDPSGFMPEGLPTDFEGLDRCNGENCPGWRFGYGVYWGWRVSNLPHWVREQLKREYFLLLDDWREQQLSRIRRGMPPGTYDPTPEQLAAENRVQLAYDLAKGVYDEFVDAPLAAVENTSNAIQAGDYAGAAVAAADVACNAAKVCKAAEKMVGAAADKMKSVGRHADDVAAKLAKTCCFVAGTLVATEGGLVPIDEIETGDRVWSRDEATGETALKPVTGLIRRHEREIWELTLAVDGDALAFFETTDDHPWRTLTGEWLPTEGLAPGMRVERAEGAPATVLSVVLTERTESTYNLEVADFHTYFVGAAGLWVHNACDPTKGPGRSANPSSQPASDDKRYSSEKQALVDMAKSDKRKGITSQDMQAYKDLNRELPDPFPTNKVRGPEAHPTGGPHTQRPHGHVGPANHVPIVDPKP